MDAGPDSITNQANGNSRNERSGKGRRRRAAAEQRRIEQERWGRWLTTPDHEAAEGEDEENADVYTNLQAPTRSVRRRNRRRKNRQGADHLDQLHLEVDDYINDNLHSSSFNAEDLSQGSNADYYEIEMALAVSLSLAQSGDGNSDQNMNHSVQEYGSDLSYERLTQLENVMCVAPAAVVNSLSVNAFVGNKASQELVEPAEICSICQCEYENGDTIMSLPCAHGFHHVCGSRWLLNYSKLCPICKLDVVEQHEG